MQRLSTDTSTNAGRAPAASIASTVATNEFGTVMTSTPGSTPKASNPSCMATVPSLTPAQYSTPQNSRIRFRGLEIGTEDELARTKQTVENRSDLGTHAFKRAHEVEQRDLGARAS